MKRFLTSVSIAAALATAPAAHAIQTPRASEPTVSANQLGGSNTILLILISLVLGSISIGDIFGDDGDPESP
jgi:hypothetical protein